jgi:hypothetical protein
VNQRQSTVLQAPGLSNWLWRLWLPFVISIALSLPLLNARALAFELYPIGNEGLGAARSLSLLKADDNSKPVVDMSTLKFDDKFKAVVDSIKTSQKASYGSLSVTTSYSNSNTRTGIGPAAEGRQDLTIAYDLADFRAGAGHMLPSTVWANSFFKQASSTTLVTSLFEGAPDRTIGGSAGATWAWSGGNAEVSFWNYSFKRLQLGDAYNSVGQGVDASISGYADRLGFYAKLSYHWGGDLSYNQAEDPASFYRSVGRGYDAFLSVSYKPPNLPDIVVGGGFGRYQFDGFEFADEGRYWSATLGLDFSKFLWRPVNIKSSVSEQAKLVYRYTNYTDQSFGVVNSNDSHFFGMIFRAALN